MEVEHTGQHGCNALFHFGNLFWNSILQFRTCSILWNFVEEISLMEHCDWSIGQCSQTSNEVSTMLFMYGFRKFISNVNVFFFERKILKVLFRNKISK